METRNSTLQIIGLIVVSALLILTALGSAQVMFWSSVVAMIGLLIWFGRDAKPWLAAFAGSIVAILVAFRLLN